MSLSISRSHGPLCLLLLGLAACGGDSSGPKENPPASLATVSGNAQNGAAGRPLQNPIVVRVNDGQGAPLSGVAVSFAVQAGNGTLSAASASTGQDGSASVSWTLGTVAGAEQRVQASVTKPDGATLVATFTATAEPGPAALVTKISGDGQQGGTSGVLRDSLVIRVTDEFGNGVQAVAVSWSAQGGSFSPAQSITNATGRAATRWTLGNDLGPATATVTTGTLAATSFNATATLSITSITPAELVPGETMTLNGIGFSAGAGSNTLTVAGLPATIQDASATSITALVPSTLPCLPSGGVTLSLVSGGLTTNRQHAARGAAPRAIAVGEVLIGSANDPLTCFELPPEGGRYLIAVTNTNTAGASGSLRLRGFSSTATPAQVTTVAARALSREAADPTGALARQSRHIDVMEKNRELLNGMLQRGDAQAALRALPAAQQVDPVVGDIVPIRIPRINLSSAQACASYDSVSARVVAVSQRGVVLEDVTNPFAGTIDTLYQRLATEFEQRQYDKVKNNFGDPLLRDQLLDNNGRLLMVFSQRVNNYNVAGFVWSGDMVGRNNCLQSNVAEVFYGYVPTVNNQDYAANSIGQWYWTIRATVVHEVKHIAAFAQRIASGASQFEETWLEEGTAMIVEELWARDLFGYAQRSNAGYLQSVGCEIRGAFNIGQCAGRPGVTWVHFGFLADWMDFPSTRTLLCRSNTECPDGNFYGTAWLFLRWLLDQSSQPEDVLLRALHNTGSAGVQNIQARFGRSFAELLPEFALAVALDDRGGFTAPSTAFTMPSWNLRDVYAGLNVEQPQAYPVAFPLSVTTFSYGNLSLDVATVRNGAAAFFELSGTPSGRQALEFSAAGGATLANGMRVTVVRIQ